MNRRIPLVAGVASGGLLTAAFLQAAVAAADSGDAADISSSAFTVGGLTFDPGEDGYDTISALFTNAPLLQMGGGALGDASLANQDLEVYGTDGTDLGSVTTGVNAANLFGIDSAQFTVTGADAATINDASADDIASVLGDSGDISGSGFEGGDLSDVAGALAESDSTNIINGDVSGDDVTSVLGDAEITISGDAGFTADDIADALNNAGNDLLPVDGTVYSITNLTSGLPFLENLGLGIYNVYEAVPAEDEDGAASISDTLVTPFGNFDLPTDYDATAPLDPTSTFAGLDPAAQPSLFGGLFGGLLGGSGGDGDNTGSGGEDDNSGSGGEGDNNGSGGENSDAVLATSAAADETDPDSGASDNAFTLGGFTYDPGADGFDKIDPLFGDAPLLEIAVGKLELPLGGKILPLPLAQQDLEVYDDTGADLGSVKADVNPSNILGIESTQLTVDYGDADADVHPAEGVDLDQLPADGTVMSVTDFGGGFMNVYEAVPNEDGTEAASITDTLVTPFGTLDLPTDFDAVAALDPGSALDGLGTPAGEGLSDDAFAIGDTTFDPGSDGWDPVTPLFGVAPLMEIGGATFDPSGLGVPLPAIDLATQNLEVYEDGELLGGIGAAVNTSNIVGIDTTQFTVDSLYASGADIASVLGDAGDISFGDDAPVSESDVAATLASNLDIGSGDVEEQDVIDALANADFAGDLGIKAGNPLLGTDATFDPDGVADGITFDPSDVASALNDNLDAAAITADLPGLGTVYSVTDLGFLGIHNVYEAIPSDGDAAPTITDTLVTPLGNFDLSTMFNALADLDPGNAVAGVDDTAGSAPFSGLIDWISGLLTGGSGSGDGLFDGLADIFGGEDGGGSDLFDIGSLLG